MSRPGDAAPVYVLAEIARPIYHRPGGATRVIDGATVHTSLCGRPLFTWRGAGRYTDHATRLRRDWAEQIGVPCSVCHRETAR